MTLTVAVTGGIGAGKSTVSARLAENGAVVADSDRLAREVVAPGSPGLAAVAEAFGPDMIGADGALDRAALAAVVFADPAARRRLEGITHPLVRARFDELRMTAPPDAVLVNDIPLLTTLAVAASFHLVVGVHADDEVRVARLVDRGLAEADARARMAAQIGDDVRRPLCDAWLANHGDAASLRVAVDRLWSERLLPLRDNIAAGQPAPRGAPRLMPPDPAWPTDAARLATRIGAAVGGARVDHIGSTAVAGFPAKDVIDLQLTVADLQQADGWAAALTAAGFPAAAGFFQDTPHPAGADPLGWQKRLHVNADPGRSLNLHVRVRDSPGWRWALLFRDWIAAEPAERASYLAVKQAAAAVHGSDSATAAYADAKEPWMAAAYPRGLEWAARTDWQPGH